MALATSSTLLKYCSILLAKLKYADVFSCKSFQTLQFISMPVTSIIFFNTFFVPVTVDVVWSKNLFNLSISCCTSLYDLLSTEIFCPPSDNHCWYTGDFSNHALLNLSIRLFSLLVLCYSVTIIVGR